MKTFKTKTVTITYVIFEEICPKSIQELFFEFLEETNSWLKPCGETVNLVRACKILAEAGDDNLWFWDWLVSYDIANEEIRKDYDTFLDNLNNILCNQGDALINLA